MSRELIQQAIDIVIHFCEIVAVIYIWEKLK